VQVELGAASCSPLAHFPQGRYVRAQLLQCWGPITIHGEDRTFGPDLVVRDGALPEWGRAFATGQKPQHIRCKVEGPKQEEGDGR
jgi:hypothetical protein